MAATRALGRRATMAIVALLAATIAFAPASPTTSAAPAARATTTTVATQRIVGDLRMADGVTLRYTVVKPVGTQHLPTLFEYSGYDPGTRPDADYIKQYVSSGAGYNYIGVNVRGTGCSTGTFDFFQPQEAMDAAAVIAWIRQQAWSDGKVGMIGKSFPGITQLFVAEQNPPGLMAIAPGHFFGDAYRDIARPGGIENYGFASLWSFIARPSYEVESGIAKGAAGDSECLLGALGEIRSATTNPFLQLSLHPYDDELYAQRSPDTNLDQLHVPMLATLSWQDEQLGSRGTDLLARLDDLIAARAAAGIAQTPWWATLTNGDHGMARTATEQADQRRFYDHFLKGIDNGWDSRPRVEVWWESGRNGPRAPGWTTGLDHWAEDQREAEGQLRPLALHLRAGGALTTAPATAGDAPDHYFAIPIAGSEGIANPSYSGLPGLPNFYLWGLKPPAGTSLSWTTAPLAGDTTMLGSGSFDVWLASSAPDTDLQVTLTEIRPDGQEVYIQKGWLKASQRALDPAQSTALRPYQTHQFADVSMLNPNQPVLARVEIFPFGTLLRKGSRLRVTLEEPTALPELWAFTPYAIPALNTVLHDPAHPSQLVLPLVPNDANRVASFPACGTVIRQPCRPAS